MNKELLNLLILLNFIFVIKNYYENRIFLVFFRMGFFLYLLLPTLLMSTKEIKDIVLIKNYYIYFEAFNNRFYELILYLLIFYFSFTGIIYLKKNKKKSKQKEENIYNLVINGLFIIFFLMGIIIIILNNKAIIFGYSVNNSFRSILASISVILTTLSIYSLLKKAVKINMKIVLTGIISFILLIMGTRMYFMLYLLSYSVFLEVEYKFTRKNKTKCILLIIVVFILLAVISLKRLNQNIDIKIGIINNLKEFLYTSLSYASYFANNKIKYISFFGDNYIFHSPLGAMNIFTSLYGGFGLIGTVIILKGLSFLLNYLSNTNNKILKTWYFILCGGLLFIFYRDPMRIYFIKVGFQYSILILIIAKFISSFLKNYKSN